MATNGNKQKYKSKTKKIIIGSIALVVFLITIAMGIGIYYIDKIKGKKLDENKIAITKKEDIKSSMNNEDFNKIHNVLNILLLGVDKQETASDSIIVLSIDETAKKIKLSSLMRDTYVDFGKDKITKLNYAYHYGGDEFAVKTVNEQFKLDIKDYIQVDFGGLTNIIDYLGGVEVDVKPNEVNLLNSYAKNISNIDKTEFIPISHSGNQLLNGQQATAYCRIRYVGNLDYQRTERQRTVLIKVMDKLLKEPISSYPIVINELTPYIKTSLSPLEIIKLADSFKNYVKNGIEQTRCPYDGLKSDSMIDGIYYMQWNREENIKKLHEFIYLDN